MMKKYYLLFASLPFLATGCAFAAGPLGLGIVSAAIISAALLVNACDDSDSSSKKGSSANEIFVTASTTAGNFGGSSEADVICANDANNPGDGTVFKAMIGSFYRDTITDWVLKANTEYTRLDETVIGTTNASATFDSGVIFSAPITSYSVDVWTGFNANWTVGLTCYDWSYGSNTYQGKRGNTSSNSVYSWSAGDMSCDSLNHLICVGQ